MNANRITIVAAGAFFLFIVIFFTIGTTYLILRSDSSYSQVSRIDEALKEFHKIRPAFADSTRPAGADSLTREVKKLLLDRQFIEMYSAHALDQTAKRAETTMQVATALITSISFVFGLVVLVVGWLSFKKHDELKIEIEKTLKEKSAIETRLAEIRRDVIDDLKKELEKASQEKSVIETQLEEIRRDVIDARKKLLDEVSAAHRELLDNMKTFQDRAAKTDKSMYTLIDAFSSTFIDIIAALGKNQIISSGEDEALRNKMIEMQYRLSLEHPEPDERQQALYGLSALGTSDSIPLLKAIIENREENAEIRLLAQQAVYAIEKRKAEKRPTSIST